MVKGHERKSYQPSSSSKAAQLLASSAPKAGGFGFGGCAFVYLHMETSSVLQGFYETGDSCCTPQPACPDTCRFSGATPVAGTSTAADATATDIDSSGNPAVAPALTGELDGEITQLLRSLSKRDATTKVKGTAGKRTCSAQ